FGVRAGALQLLGGLLSEAAYHVAVPSPGSLRAADYGPPIALGGGTRLVRATGSYGEGLSGSPLLHIHGVLAEPPGRGHGGLIAPTFEGAEGVPRRIEGPAVELLSLSGEISLEEGDVEAAGVSGVVGDPAGAIWAGRFVRGQNPVCITIEAVLEELLSA